MPQHHPIRPSTLPIDRRCFARQLFCSLGNLSISVEPGRSGLQPGSRMIALGII